MIDTQLLHPMIVHFPIALLIVGLLADAIGLVFKKEFYSKAGFYLLILGTLGVIAAYFSGNLAGEGEQLGETMGKVTPEFTVKSTKENLEDAINGESYEVATMYPGFIKTANDGKVNIALISFNYAYQTEKKHKDFYKEALDKLNNKQEKSLPAKYYACSTCGNTYAGTTPKRCGISMTPSERFITIDEYPYALIKLISPELKPGFLI